MSVSKGHFSRGGSCYLNAAHSHQSHWEVFSHNVCVRLSVPQFLMVRHMQGELTTGFGTGKAVEMWLEMWLEYLFVSTDCTEMEC